METQSLYNSVEFTKRKTIHGTRIWYLDQRKQLKWLRIPSISSSNSGCSRQQLHSLSGGRHDLIFPASAPKCASSRSFISWPSPSSSSELKTRSGSNCRHYQRREHNLTRIEWRQRKAGRATEFGSKWRRSMSYFWFFRRGCTWVRITIISSNIGEWLNSMPKICTFRAFLSFKHVKFLRRRRQPEENISYARMSLPDFWTSHL